MVLAEVGTGEGRLKIGQERSITKIGSSADE